MTISYVSEVDIFLVYLSVNSSLQGILAASCSEVMFPLDTTTWICLISKYNKVTPPQRPSNGSWVSWNFLIIIHPEFISQLCSNVTKRPTATFGAGVSGHYEGALSVGDPGLFDARLRDRWMEGSGVVQIQGQFCLTFSQKSINIESNFSE